MRSAWRKTASGDSRADAKNEPIMTVLAPCAKAFTISPEFFIPPSAITGTPVFLAAANFENKIWQYFWTVFCVRHFWMKLQPKKIPFFISHCRYFAVNSWTDFFKPLWKAFHLVAMAHPHSLFFWKRAKNFGFSVDKRTMKSATYLDYKGVCVVHCGRVAILRRLGFISEGFCSKILEYKDS